MSKPATPRAVGDRRPILGAMLNPKSVAVIGASENVKTVGRTLMENLKSFTGGVYPVNPKRSSILGLEAFPKIGDVPRPIDLAVIATPRSRRSGHGERMRGRRRKGRSHCFSRVPRKRRHRFATGGANPCTSRQNAFDWAGLHRRDDSKAWPERNVRQNDGSAWKRSFHQSKRGTVYGGPGLESA